VRRPETTSSGTKAHGSQHPRCAAVISIACRGRGGQSRRGDHADHLDDVLRDLGCKRVPPPHFSREEIPVEPAWMGLPSAAGWKGIQLRDDGIILD